MREAEHMAGAPASAADLLAQGHDTQHGLDSPLHGLPVRLAPDQLVELADLVAERLQRAASPADSPRLVDAGTVGRAIGMTAAYVREHAAELGGCRMGDGPRPRWRFDLDRAAAAWTSLSTSRPPLVPDSAPQARSRRRRSAQSGSGVPLLPVRGSEGTQEARHAA
jgi:hypothetical protein